MNTFFKTFYTYNFFYIIDFIYYYLTSSTPSSHIVTYIFPKYQHTHITANWFLDLVLEEDLFTLHTNIRCAKIYIHRSERTIRLIGQCIVIVLYLFSSITQMFVPIKYCCYCC